MDNDQMARRLRPPSGPLHPAATDELEQHASSDQSSLASGDISSTHGAAGAPDFATAPEFAAPWETPSEAAGEHGAPWDTPESSAAPWETDPAATAAEASATDSAPWDRPADTAAETDMTAAGQPAWDRPSAAESAPATSVDDRYAQLFASYAAFATPATEALPEVLGGAEPVAERQLNDPASFGGDVSADPDDALAPVVNDLAEPVGHAWPDMNGSDPARNAPMPDLLEPSASAGSPGSAAVEPEWLTPSDWSVMLEPDPEDGAVADASHDNEAQLTFDAVAEGALEASPESAFASEPPSEPLWVEDRGQSDAVAPPTYEERGLEPTPPPDLFADSGTSEVATGESATGEQDPDAFDSAAEHMETADDWLADDPPTDHPTAGLDTATPPVVDAASARDPSAESEDEAIREFEPLATFTTPVVHQDGSPNVVVRIELAIVGDGKHPAAPAREDLRQPEVDPPSLTPASLGDVPMATDALPVAEDAQGAVDTPQSADAGWLDAEASAAAPGAADAEPWARPIDDPLSDLPAAPIVPNRARESEQRQAAGQSARTQQAAGSSAAKDDLWFLAAEPQGGADAAVAAPKGQLPDVVKESSLLTAGLTIAMAVLVVILVFVFIQFMTSLFR